MVTVGSSYPCSGLDQSENRVYQDNIHLTLLQQSPTVTLELLRIPQSLPLTKLFPAVPCLKPLKPLFNMNILVKDFLRPSRLGRRSIRNMEQIRKRQLISSEILLVGKNIIINGKYAVQGSKACSYNRFINF